VSEAEDTRPILNPHGPPLRDFAWEDLPAEAWFDDGQSPDGAWILELRATHIPYGHRDLFSDHDGERTGFRMFLTTKQRSDWERRWTATARGESAAADALRAARAERMAIDGLRVIPPNSGQTARATHYRDLIVAAYSKLEDQGLFGKRGLRPTQLQVAKEIGVDLSTLKRWRKECELAWPPARDP